MLWEQALARSFLGCPCAVKVMLLAKVAIKGFLEQQQLGMSGLEKRSEARLSTEFYGFTNPDLGQSNAQFRGVREQFLRT